MTYTTTELLLAAEVRKLAVARRRAQHAHIEDSDTRNATIAATGLEPFIESALQDIRAVAAFIRQSPQGTQAD